MISQDLTHYVLSLDNDLKGAWEFRFGLHIFQKWKE